MSDDASGSVICTHEVSFKSRCGCIRNRLRDESIKLFSGMRQDI